MFVNPENWYIWNIATGFIQSVKTPAPLHMSTLSGLFCSTNHPHRLPVVFGQKPNDYRSKNTPTTEKYLDISLNQYAYGGQQEYSVILPKYISFLLS